jgi:uncharacterized protein
MRIDEIIWREQVVDKLASKHAVTPDEVEQLFQSSPRFRRIESGDRTGEDVYAAAGRTWAGRYLLVFFILKQGGGALILSAREMTRAERRASGR